MSDNNEVQDLRADAKRVYLLLKKYFGDSENYWQLGCCFDTMTDFLRILGPETDPEMPKLALTKYHQTSGAWYDDYAWWAIASAKAYDPAFGAIFRDFAQSFMGIAQGCWAVLDQGTGDGVHNGASLVFENRDNQSFFTEPPVVPEYWVTPRFDTGAGSGLHGVWQKDIFANGRYAPNWTGPSEYDPNPSKPSVNTKLGPYQNTVVNALYYLTTVRLEQARRIHPHMPSVAQNMIDEHGFLWTWMGLNPAYPLPQGLTLLNGEFNDQTYVVLERVSTYAMFNGSYPNVENWDARTSWAGDQGLMINALAGYMQLRPGDPVIPQLLRSLLLGYARHEVDGTGMPQPYYPITGNKLAEWDFADYASGTGVFMRGVLQAARIRGGPVELFVRQAEFQAFLRGAVAWAQKAAPTDLFSSLNVLATLLAGIELLLQ
jgi:hypothetical protein